VHHPLNQMLCFSRVREALVKERGPPAPTAQMMMREGSSPHGRDRLSLALSSDRRARGGRFFRRPTRARPRRSASGAGDTPTLSRHAVLGRWCCRHVAGRMLDVGRIRSGLGVVCCRLRLSCVADGGGELRRAFLVAAAALAAIAARTARFAHSARLESRCCVVRLVAPPQRKRISRIVSSKSQYSRSRYAP
jgi:hypothetical protein